MIIQSKTAHHKAVRPLIPKLLFSESEGAIFLFPTLIISHEIISFICGGVLPACKPFALRQPRTAGTAFHSNRRACKTSSKK
jgi:hypothetical protein